MKISSWQWANLIDRIDNPLVKQSDIIPDVPVKVKVNRSDIIPDVPLPMPPGIICFWKKTRETIPSSWALCDGLWYDPLDMTPGQVGQVATDANHPVRTESLLDKFIPGAEFPIEKL